MRKTLVSERPKDGSDRVYVSRGKTGAPREIANETEMEAALAREGFITLHPELETPKTIVKVLSAARIVVLMEGSAQNHVHLSLPAGAALVTIQPSIHFNGFSKLCSDVSGIKFAFVVADRHNEDSNVNITRLLKTIELVAD